MADIGLEFVGANPSLLGVGGNGEGFSARSPPISRT
jgi:hypothetical protein